MPKPAIDYTVYLVTDSTPAVLGAGRTVAGVVGAALEGGRGSIGVVQLREKQADAQAMLATLAAMHEAAAAAPGRNKLPALLVNDRVDVAAAAMARGHCAGVHLGQDDLDVATARRLLGADAVIGVTASTPAEAVAACRAGADYLGLGTVFATPTKTNTKHVVGPAGVQRMLRAVAAAGFAHVPAVCIGGIHAANARRVVFQSAFAGDPAAGDPAAGIPPKALAGVAVVSAVMAAPDPAAAAAALAREVRLGLTQGPTAFCRGLPPDAGSDAGSDTAGTGLPAAALVQRVLRALHATTPLSHNMTNTVVQNFAANVALAVGASPIMSGQGAEAADLARLPGSALVVNMGTLTPDSLAAHAQAIAAYNAAGRPVVFDPVGAGATAVRRAAVRAVLAAGYLDVIKGNEREIQAVYRAGLGDEDDDDDVDDDEDDESATTAPTQQRGVDGGAALGPAARVALARRVAARYKCVVVLTGAVDVVCDAGGRARLCSLADGHPLLAQVTGTGCALGTVLSAAVAAAASLPTESACTTYDAVVAAMLLYERAAARAAAEPAVRGPGSFVPAFLDQLALCRTRAAAGDMAWLQSDAS